MSSSENNPLYDITLEALLKMRKSLYDQQDAKAAEAWARGFSLQLVRMKLLHHRDLR